MNEGKRLFLGFEAHSPWREHILGGRIIRPEMRHMTMLFLGQTAQEGIDALWKKIPPPPFRVALCGYFSKVLFLPFSHPNVVAYEAVFQQEEPLQHYYQSLCTALNIHENRFLPHVTIARKPFDSGEWEKDFQKAPVVLGNFHLYESLGNLTYNPLFTHPIAAPFEAFPHTADIAFTIRGESIEQLYASALAALMFEDIRMINNPPLACEIASLDHVIRELNRQVAFCDQYFGCSFKAVSYSGKVHRLENGILEWEMIVDV